MIIAIKYNTYTCHMTFHRMSFDSHIHFFQFSYIGVGKVTSEDEIEISVEGFSQPRPVVSDDDEEERRERQCVEANILIDCTNSVSAIFDVCVVMEVSKPVSVHPSTINIPTIGKINYY